MSRLVLCAFAFVSTALICAGVPRFSGVFSQGGDDYLFSVQISEATKPQWVKIGDVLDGYRIKAYLPESRVLTLANDAGEYPVALAVARIAELKPDDPEERVRASASAALKRMEKWEDGVSYKIAKLANEIYYVVAWKEVDGKKQLRGLRVSPEGRLLNMAVLKGTIE